MTALRGGAVRIAGLSACAGVLVASCLVSVNDVKDDPALDAGGGGSSNDSGSNPDSHASGGASGSGASGGSGGTSSAGASGVGGGGGAGGTAGSAGNAGSAGAGAGPDTLLDGLIGWWELDDTSGTEAHDSSGNGHQGTLVNGPTWSSGKLGGALSFDGTNDRVEIGTSAKVGLQYPMSLAAWVNADALPGQSSIVGRDRTEPSVVRQFEWRVQQDGKLTLTTYPSCSTTGQVEASSTAVLTTGKWTHLAVTVDASQNVTFYVDGAVGGGGKLASAQICTSSAPTSFGGTSYIVGTGPDPAYKLDGKLDDVRLYDRVLTEKEVAQLAAQ